MSECSGIAIEADANFVLVELPARAQACGNCKSADGCHTGILGLSSGPRRYRVANDIGARVGDRVSIRVAEGAVLRASLISYLLPALLAIFGAAIGQMMAGDLAALAGTISGLVLGAFWLRRSELRARQDQNRFSLQLEHQQTHLLKEIS
jgi:sigma-E factor negative regulatory protein RseC